VARPIPLAPLCPRPRRPSDRDRPVRAEPCLTSSSTSRLRARPRETRGRLPVPRRPRELAGLAGRHEGDEAHRGRARPIRGALPVRVKGDGQTFESTVTLVRVDPPREVPPRRSDPTATRIGVEPASHARDVLVVEVAGETRRRLAIRRPTGWPRDRSACPRASTRVPGSGGHTTRRSVRSGTPLWATVPSRVGGARPGPRRISLGLIRRFLRAT
jgi:hypothetical protein